MSTEPLAVIDVELFRELLSEQVRRHEITRAEARQAWQIHAVPVIRWNAKAAVHGVNT